MKILVTGAGGFIGGHIVKKLLSQGHRVRAVDIKPFDEWFQHFKNAENFSKDLTDKKSCFDSAKDMDAVINMACNMGGMGFIENNKALCMLSVLVNTHMLMACKEYKIKSFSDRKNIGIWVNHKKKIKKISAIGIKVKHWIAYHGFSININNDLESYKKIIPCGITDKDIASLMEIKNQNYNFFNKKIIKNFIRYLKV